MYAASYWGQATCLSGLEFYAIWVSSELITCWSWRWRKPFLPYSGFYFAQCWSMPDSLFVDGSFLAHIISRYLLHFFLFLFYIEIVRFFFLAFSKSHFSIITVSNDFFYIWMSVFVGQRWRHVRHVCWHVGKVCASMVVLKTLPLFFHFTLHLRGALTLHRSHNGYLRNYQGAA